MNTLPRSIFAVMTVLVLFSLAPPSPAQQQMPTGPAQTTSPVQAPSAATAQSIAAPAASDATAAPEPATVLYPGGRLPPPEPADAQPAAGANLISISASAGAWPETLDVGVADPSSPGQPWWKYRRMDVPGQPPGPPREQNGGGSWPR